MLDSSIKAFCDHRVKQQPICTQVSSLYISSVFCLRLSDPSLLAGSAVKLDKITEEAEKSFRTL